MTAAEPHEQDWTAGPTSSLLDAMREKICPFVRNRVDGARVHGSDQKLQVGSDRLKMTVEVVSRGHKTWK